MCGVHRRPVRMSGCCQNQQIKGNLKRLVNTVSISPSKARCAWAQATLCSKLCCHRFSKTPMRRQETNYWLKWPTTSLWVRVQDWEDLLSCSPSGCESVSPQEGLMVLDGRPDWGCYQWQGSSHQCYQWQGTSHQCYQLPILCTLVQQQAILQ